MLRQIQNINKWEGKKLPKNYSYHSVPTTHFVSVYSGKIYPVSQYGTPTMENYDAYDCTYRRLGIDIASDISIDDLIEIERIMKRYYHPELESSY